MYDYQTTYHSPLGEISIVCSDDALLALRLPGQPKFHSPHIVQSENHPILVQTALWLDRYFAGASPDPRQIPVTPQGSAFRIAIWNLLLDIPYGQTCTYGELARRYAQMAGIKKMSPQAVGNAVGANPIAIIIPCHRCLGAGGTLTGYAGGLHLKRYLLGLEQIPYKDL